jgi:nucleoside-diphosphate-sugar epimerase
MKHAVIVGIGGISGHKLAEELLSRGDWKVTGIGTKPTPYPELNKNVHQLICCNLQNDSEVRQKLSKLNDVTHVFYQAWASAENDRKTCEINAKMLDNLLTTLNQHSTNLQHVVLQTGVKYYGMVDGPSQGMVTPYHENDPRLSKPNFYYNQEDVLKDLSKRQGWRYSIARPPCIVGSALRSPMNFGTSLAVYASVMKELGKPLIFPSEVGLPHIREIIDVGLLARFAIWASLHPFTNGEAFNITNGDSFRFENLWPKIADYFGMDWKIEKNFSVKDFMQQNKETWQYMCRRNGLLHSEIDDLGDFGFFEAILGRDWDDLSVVSKAREFGFSESLNSETCFYNLFDELQLKKVIPKVRRVGSGPAKRH